MDQEIYRFVPLRFVVNESDADMCKIEQLTNLFPDMKAIIELELFKFNNFERMVERLSTIYTPSSAIDTRDDTLHLFLGPYHLAVGPATFGALRFKNVSKALLASSHPKISNENTRQYQKRRHDAALRRFRRAVRKLIQIRLYISKLRLASILTPYNQYQLYTQGIYDLVLAGHIHNSDSVFTDDDFLERFNDLRSMNDFDEQNPLVASNFVKINTLLHLLSPSPQTSESHLKLGKTSQIGTDYPNTFPTNENSSQPFLDSSMIRYSHHFQNGIILRFPMNRSMSHQYTPETRSRRSSRFSSRQNSSVLSEQIITNSLPDLSSADNFNPNLPSSSNTSRLDKAKTLVPIQSNILVHREDLFVDRISTLVTNYLQQSTAIPADNHSLTIETNEFDSLLQRIRTVVDHNLSLKTSNNPPQKLPVSHAGFYQESPTNGIDVRHLKPSFNKRKLLVSSQSQSCDETHLQSFSTIPELTDISVEF